MTGRAGWARHRLADVADLVGGGTPSRSEPSYFGGPVPWVTPTDLAPIGEVRILGPVAESLTEAGLQSSSAKRLPPGTVLFSSRASIGKIAITDRECATNQGFANFIPKPGLLDAKFLAYLLRAETPEILRLAGETTFKEVSRGKLREHEVEIPRLGEQRRIVARIEEAMSLVDEIKSERTGVASIQASLLPATLEDLFRAVASDELPLADLLCVEPQNGLYLPKDQYSEDAGSSVAMVHMGDMFRRFELAAEFPRRVLADGRLLRKYGLNPGDVLVARRSIVFEGSASMTEVPVLREPLLFESSIIRIRPGPRLLPGFLVAYFFSRTGTERRLAIARKATISGINQPGLLSLRVPVPPTAVQARIIRAVAEMRRAVEDLRGQDASTEITALRVAILRKAFAGEL